jgi:ankyrin repeat protein
MSDIFEAAQNGSVKKVRKFVESGVDVDSMSEDDLQFLSPLMLAAREGHIETVRYLIAQGADVTLRSPANEWNRDYVNFTAISFAIREGRIEVMKLLLEQYPGIDSPIDGFGNTALILAAGSNNYEMVKYLAEQGADTTIKNNSGSTALIFGADSDNLNLVKLLVRDATDIEVTNDYGDSPISVAEHKKVIKFLKSFGSAKVRKAASENNSQKTSLELAAAARDGKFGRVKRLFGSSTDLTATVDGKTALHHAVEQGHHKIVKYLVGKGADVNKMHEYGRYALHDAAWDGNVAIIKTLLKAGAERDVTSSSGDTPKDLAEIRNLPKAARLL